MYLIYDASAISTPNSYKAPFSDTFAWPRLLHISWILLSEDFKPIEDFDCIIKPSGYTLDDKILEKTKLEASEIEKRGEESEDVMTAFNASAEKAKFIFCHNQNYNENIVAAECMRRSVEIKFFKKERFCLMQEGTYFCKIASKTGGYKWPSLPELHAACFHTKYSPANNARADVIAAARCFIKLMKNRHLEDLFED